MQMGPKSTTATLTDTHYNGLCQQKGDFACRTGTYRSLSNYNGLAHTFVNAFAREVSLHAYSYIHKIGRKLKTMNAKNTKKSLILENADANMTCEFGDGDISRSRSRWPHTHTHTHTPHAARRTPHAARRTPHAARRTHARTHGHIHRSLARLY